ncbi:polysaccharide biosynthesis PFTS motif protein [Candidatus Omnitrophota bacterium]
MAKIKVVIFEEILPVHRLLVSWYALNKKQVGFLRLGRLAKEAAWVQRYLNKGRLRQITLEPGTNVIRARCYDLAYENIDKFFRMLDENKIGKAIERLYADRGVSLVFKKVINEKLARLYYLATIWQKLYPGEKFAFCPADGVDRYRTDGCEIYDYFRFGKWANQAGASWVGANNVYFPLWSRAVSGFNLASRKLQTLVKASGLLFWFFLKALKSVKPGKPSKKHYKYAIMITSPLRQFSNRIQKVDFLLDSRYIQAQQAIFIPGVKRLSKQNERYLIEQGLNYIQDPDAYISLTEIKQILPAYSSVLFSIFRESPLILETALRAVYFYLRWMSISRVYGFDNLITHSNIDRQGICRNVIIKKNGTKTWYYMDSQNYELFFVPNGYALKAKYSNSGFLNYDFFISWSNLVSDYFRSSSSAAVKYFNLGCLWAEHLKEIAEGRIDSQLREQLSRKGYQKELKLVSVFDSTYLDTSKTTYTDGIKFVKAIYRLLEDLPDIFIIFKEKKARGFVARDSQQLIFWLEKLQGHPRCYLPLKNMNSCEASAFSELTISFAFGSPTFEALAARKKSIFYDPSDKFRDTLYDKIPGLVCHDYGQLLQRAKQLLFDVDREAYNKYLDEFVKGEFEPYLDSQALTRMRRLLTGELH